MKWLRPSILPVISGLLCLACGPSTQAVPAASPAKTADADPGGRATILAADMKAHVELLASDAYAGRETLEPGYEKAAAYVAKNFYNYGLRPLPGRDDYALDYALDQYGFEKDATSASISIDDQNKQLKLESDFAPFPFSDSGTATAEVVFAGYGITAPELGWDDYEKLNVKGKFVLILRHAPNEEPRKPRGKGQADDAESGKSKNKFEGTAHQSFMAKAMNAQKHGAVGMLLVTDLLHHDGGDDFHLGHRLALPPTPEQLAKRKLAMEKRKAAEQAQVAKSSKRHKRSRRGKGKGARSGKPEGSLLAIHVSQDIARQLAGSADLKGWQRDLDRGATHAHQLRLPEVSATVTVKTLEKPRRVSAKNVLGYLAGSDPVLKDEWIVIGGHYDHLGAGSGKGDNVYNGADDNASGTSGVLELAQAFASLPVRPKRSIVFAAFSGEEKGLLGSRALLSQKLIPADKIVFMLNLDMIGRNPERPVEVVGDGYGTHIRDATERANADIQLPLEFGGTSYAGNSDHHPFFTHDIPVMFFFTGLHQDYHQASDHSDKLSYERMEQIVRVAYGVAEQFAGGVTPRFIHQVLWLGAEIRVVDARDGAHAVVFGVEEHSRAAQAGLAVGDRIVRFGQTELSDPSTIGKRFREIEPGSRGELGVVRELDTGSVKTIAVEFERAHRGYLGVYPGRVDKDVRKKLGLPDNEGLLIRQVTKDGPAAKSGIKDGDILIRIAGLPVNAGDLGRHLARIGAGEKVAIVVVRDETRVELEMVLGERPTRRRP